MKRLSMLLCLLALCLPVAAQTTPAQTTAQPALKTDAPPTNMVDLPVTRVVMYSSGVGYVEHSGTIDGEAAVGLMFKTGQINDVLKSMIVADETGQVTSVKYASRDPLTRALQSFAIDLAGDPSMAAILKQLRGAQVIVRSPEEIKGRVVGVETRKKQIIEAGQPVVIEEPVLNLLTAGGLKSIPTYTIASIELVDEKLQKELAAALELLATSNDKERKAVEIHFSGKGKRKVSIGYVVEMPVWKVSYRLDLKDDKSHLQGWAIVENTSDSDWTNVELSLVSGRPVSFIQDLYTPLYLDRPVVKPQLFASLRPRMYEEGRETADDVLALQAEKERDGRAEIASGRRMRGMTADMPAPMVPSGRAGYADYRDGTNGLSLADGWASVQAQATSGKAGEMFRFTIKNPVSLGRRRSAMLPIVTGEIAAQKLSIYNQQQLAKNPMNGAWITNSTGMKLMGGPVTIYADGAYAGDAIFDNMVQDEKRLVSYAVDLEVTVDPTAKSDSRITEIVINQGALRIRRLYTFSQTYVIKNKADADRKVMVEHPYNSSRKLVEPKEPAEKTDQYYRFLVTVPADKTGEFVVREEQVIDEVIGLVNANWNLLIQWSNNTELSKEAREALLKAARLNQQLVEMQRNLNETQQQLNQIINGQARIRENLKVVGNDSTLGQRYLKTLSNEEDQIEELQKKIVSLREDIEAKRSELTEYVNNLSLK